MPFLSIITRCYKRPAMLGRNIESVRMQADQDLEHIFLVDDLGRGLWWANKQFYRHRDVPKGDYILMLDDDDMLTRHDIVEQFKAATVDRPDLVMCKFDCGPWGILPSDAMWEAKWPKLSHVGTPCFITRRDVWHEHIHKFGEPNAGDYSFLAGLFPHLKSVVWLDLIIGKIQRIGNAPQVEVAYRNAHRVL